MITEKGSLRIGVEYEGKKHTEFELRPQRVKDSIDVLEEDPRALRNESYFGLCVLAKQIVRLGEVPKERIKVGLLMDMYQVDLAVISGAAGRLQERMARFQGEGKTHNEGDARSEEAGV